MVDISHIFNLDKKLLLMLILISKFDINIIDVAIIGVDAYYAANK